MAKDTEGKPNISRHVKKTRDTKVSPRMSVQWKEKVATTPTRFGKEYTVHQSPSNARSQAKKGMMKPVKGAVKKAARTVKPPMKKNKE